MVTGTRRGDETIKTETEMYKNGLGGNQTPGTLTFKGLGEGRLRGAGTVVGGGFPQPPFTPLRAVLRGEEVLTTSPNRGAVLSTCVFVPTDIRVTLPNAELSPHGPLLRPGHVSPSRLHPHLTALAVFSDFLGDSLTYSATSFLHHFVISSFHFESSFYNRLFPLQFI